MSTYYCGIDLHARSCHLCVLDAEGHRVQEGKLPNELETIVAFLAPYQPNLSVAIESTINWYWLVDGLMEAGYQVHLVNTAAVKQYEGLKYSDDHSDARWLAHLLRLGILPEGYIYPKAGRAVRDLLRKRGQLVQLRTTNILSIQNLVSRNTGSSMSANRIKKLTSEEVDELFPAQDIAMAIKTIAHKLSRDCYYMMRDQKSFELDKAFG